MRQIPPVFDLKAAEIDPKALWNEKSFEELKSTWETFVNEISSSLGGLGTLPEVRLRA